jgi:hypothetical protein
MESYSTNEAINVTRKLWRGRAESLAIRMTNCSAAWGHPPPLAALYHVYMQQSYFYTMILREYVARFGNFYGKCT